MPWIFTLVFVNHENQKKNRESESFIQGIKYFP